MTNNIFLIEILENSSSDEKYRGLGSPIKFVSKIVHIFPSLRTGKYLIKYSEKIAEYFKLIEKLIAQSPIKIDKHI